MQAQSSSDPSPSAYFHNFPVSMTQNPTERRRKGTETSCELTLVECASQSESSANSVQRIYFNALVTSIRHELLEFTDPERYAAQNHQQIQLAQKSLLRQKTIRSGTDLGFETPIYEENENDLGQIDDIIRESVNEDEMTPKKNGEEENSPDDPFGSFRDKIEASLGTPKQQVVETGLNPAMEDSKQRNSSQSRKQALSLSIKIEEVPEKIYSTENSPSKHNLSVEKHAGSCDKSANKNQFFSGIQRVQINPSNINSQRNSPNRKNATRSRKSSDDPKYFVAGPQQQNPWNHIQTSDQRYENMSPISSNLSSYYFDRLEELLPEKKLVTQKKMQRNQDLYSLQRSNEGQGISPMMMPQTPLRGQGGFGPFQRSMNFGTNTSVSSMSRRIMFRKKGKDANNQSAIPSFQARKAMLKESLTKYKDLKAEKKDLHKKKTSIALKFLRKLARKLKRPIVRKTLCNVSNYPSHHGSSIISPYSKYSPSKSQVTDESPDKRRISPRQSLYQFQQLASKVKLPPPAFTFNLMTTNNDDFGMSPMVPNKTIPENVDGTFNHQIKNHNVFVSQGSGFADAIKSINSMQSDGINLLPLPAFNKQEPAISFDMDRLLLDDPKEQPALSKEKSSDFGIHMRNKVSIHSQASSCDFGKNRSDSLIMMAASHSGPQVTHQHQSSNISQTLEEAGRLVTFAGCDHEMMQAYLELQQMQSPVQHLNQIKPELDEVEEEIMEAIQEYRDDDYINDFKNYKNYYNDAQQQNRALAKEERQTMNKQEFTQFLGYSSNLEIGGGYDRNITFKDQRQFLSPDHQWQQHDEILLTDNSKQHEQVLDIYNLLDTPEKSQDDAQPQIDPNPPNPWPETKAQEDEPKSLQKSDKKSSSISQSSQLKISKNLKNLTQMLENLQTAPVSRSNSNQLIKFRTEQQLNNNASSDPVTARIDYYQGNLNQKQERQYDSSGSRSRRSRVQKQIDRYMASIGKKTPSPSPPKDSKKYERELFSDKKAVHSIFNNLKALCADLKKEDKKNSMRLGTASKLVTQTMSTKESPELVYMAREMQPVRLNLMPKLNLSAIKQMDSSEEEATTTNQQKTQGQKQQKNPQITVQNSQMQQQQYRGHLRQQQPKQRQNLMRLQECQDEGATAIPAQKYQMQFKRN